MKKTISFDVETGRRLAAFAGHNGLAVSKVIADALKVHMEGFRAFHVDAESAGRPIRLAEPVAESA